MVTLSQVQKKIAEDFCSNEDMVDVTTRFGDLVKEHGINQIYVVEFNSDYVTFDMMGESTEWSVLFEENKEFFDEYSTIEDYNNGFLFSENEMYVYISSLD